MKRLFPLLLLPLLVGADCASEAKAATKPPTISVRAVANDLWVIWKSSIVGADSVQVTVAVTSQPSQTKSYTGASKTDSVKFVRPAQGQTVTVSATAVGFKAGQKGPTSVPRTATYTEPVVVPTPVIDSLIIHPASFTIESGGTQQMCAFVGFRGSGHVGLRGAEASTAYCVQTYQARYPVTVRALSAAERVVADTTCVKWIATGAATITAELCSGVPG